MVQHKINKKITISIFASRVIVVTAAPTENHMGVDIVKRVTTIMVIVKLFSIIDIIGILYIIFILIMYVITISRVR